MFNKIHEDTRIPEILFILDIISCYKSILIKTVMVYLKVVKNFDELIRYDDQRKEWYYLTKTRPDFQNCPGFDPSYSFNIFKYLLKHR